MYQLRLTLLSLNARRILIVITLLLIARNSNAQQVVTLIDTNGNLINVTANALWFTLRDGAGNNRSANVNGANQLTVSVDNVPHVICDSGCSSSAGFADNSAFTFGTTAINPIGGVLDDVATNQATENSAAIARITSFKALHVNFRNNSGIEIGTAANPIQVSLANTAANATPVTVSGSGNFTVTQATGSNLHVVIDSGSLTANQSVNLVQLNGNTIPLGDVNNVATITTFPDQVPVGRYNATLPTLTDTQYNMLQVGSRGSLQVNLMGNNAGVGATIKAASTAAIATDTSLVTALSPNTPLPTGANVIGHVITDSGTVTANQGTAAALTGGWPIVNGVPAQTTGSISTGTGTLTVSSVTGYGSVLINVGANGGGSTTFVVDESLDGATFPASLPMMCMSSTGTNWSEQVSEALATGESSACWINIPGGVTTLRIRRTDNTSGTSSFTVAPSSDTVSYFVNTVNQGNATVTAAAWPIKVTDGTNTATVKASGVAPTNNDSALVVTVSPNSNEVKESGGNLSALLNQLTLLLTELNQGRLASNSTIPSLSIRGSLGNYVGSIGDSMKVIQTITDPCGAAVKNDAAISQTATTKIIPATPGYRIYICQIRIVVGAAEITSELEGTGSNCGTGTVAHSGSTTAANGESFAANGGYQSGSGTSTVITIPAGKDFCIGQSTSSRVSGKVSYVYGQ